MKKNRIAHTGRLAVLALLLGPLLLGGCDAGDRPDRRAGLTAPEFVDVVVAIREAERGVARDDSAQALFADRRDSILEAHGTTEEELQAFLSAHRRDVAFLQTVWDTITERLKYAPPSADTMDEEDVMQGEDPVWTPRAARRTPPGDDPLPTIR